MELNNFIKTVKSQNANSTIQDYAKKCLDYTESELDPLFLKCFYNELLECGFKQEAKSIITQFKDNPVLQTAHHLTATNGAVFSAIDLINLIGLEEKYYLVGVFSGIPFANSAWTGWLSCGNLDLAQIIKVDNPIYHKLKKEIENRIKDKKETENRIRLVNSNFRDDLVFESTFEKYRLEIWEHLTEEAISYFPKPMLNSSFSNWHLNCCTKIQSKLFDTNNIIYFDLCRLIKNYLILAIQNNHLELINFFSLFKPIEKELNPIWFYSREKKKTWKIKPLYTKDLDFFINKEEICLSLFTKCLKQVGYGPSTFVTFFILVFLQKIRCLGSFYQVLYLQEYQHYLKKILKTDKINYNHNWGKTLTTGKLTENGKAVYPLEYLLNQKTIKLKNYQGKKIGELWSNI